MPTSTDPSTAMLPQIVICGVRKCGTTSLFRWLGAHPDVCPATVKETRFLMDRESPYHDPEHSVHTEGLAGYGRFFGHWNGESHRLEATSRYYDQQTALDVLGALETPPHAVFLLRDPVARLASAFEYARNNRSTIRRDVTFDRFVDALEAGQVEDILAASDDGSSKFAQDTRNEVSQLARELGYGHYIHRLRAWRDAYPAERLHVLLFEDLVARPRRFTQQLAAAVGLDPSFYADYAFRKENATVRVRNHRLHSVVRRVAPFVPRTGLTRSAYRLYLNLQGKGSRGTAAGEIDPTRQRLAEHYADSNRALAESFGLDLSAWTQPPRGR